MKIIEGHSHAQGHGQSHGQSHGAGANKKARRTGPDASAAETVIAERRALYLVAATFFLLCAYIAFGSIGALISGKGPESSAVGLILAVLSLLIMPTLAYLKQRTGREMGSQALQADAAETWIAPTSRWRSWPVWDSTAPSVGGGPIR